MSVTQTFPKNAQSDSRTIKQLSKSFNMYYPTRTIFSQDTQVLENLLKHRLNTEGLFGNLAVGLVSNVLQDISEEDPRIQVLIRPQQPERL